jgi:DNA polymerase III subunit delta'
MLNLFGDFLENTKRNDTNLKVLGSSIETGSISHAYLFSGNDIEKLMLAALYFSASVNCPEKGCGNCPVCHNTMKQIYENLLVIEPLGTNITMDLVQEIQDFVKLSPRLNSFKICIIKEADQLNKEAANKLLKTLEEPPDNKSLFILLTENLPYVMTTIASRCIIFEWDIRQAVNSGSKVDFTGLDGLIKSGLKKVIAGSTGYENALDLSSEIDEFFKNNMPRSGTEDKNTLEKFKNTGATIKETKKFEGILKSKNRKISNKYYSVGLNTVFDIITAWLEDVFSVSQGAHRDLLNYPDNFEFIKENTAPLREEEFLSLVSGIEEDRSRMKYSVNYELVLDAIFLNIKNLVKK